MHESRGTSHTLRDSRRRRRPNISKHHEINDPQIFAKCPDKTPRRDPYKARLAVAVVLTILLLGQNTSVKLIGTAAALSCPEPVLVGLSFGRGLRGQYMTSKPIQSRSGACYITKTSLPPFQALECALKDLGGHIAMPLAAELACSRAFHKLSR